MRVLLYGPIGKIPDPDGVTARDVAEMIRGADPSVPLDVRINSEGGEVSEAVAIGRVLRTHPAGFGTTVDGVAASAASYLAVLGDTRSIAADGWMMIHDPSGGFRGGSADLRGAADYLDMVAGTMAEAYGRRSKLTADAVAAAMRAETWYTPAEAVAAGLVDEVLADEPPAALSVSAAMGFARVPNVVMVRRDRFCVVPPSENSAGMSQPVQTAPAETPEAPAATDQNPAAATPAGDEKQKAKPAEATPEDSQTPPPQEAGATAPAEAPASQAAEGESTPNTPAAPAAEASATAAGQAGATMTSAVAAVFAQAKRYGDAVKDERRGLEIAREVAMSAEGAEPVLLRVMSELAESNATLRAQMSAHEAVQNEGSGLTETQSGAFMSANKGGDSGKPPLIRLAGTA